MIYIIILLNILLLLSGQILWKFGVSKMTSWDLVSVINLMLSPLILAGLILYALATVFWLYILSKVPLSIAYPFQSLTYVFGIVAGYLIFKENVSFVQWCGVILLVLAVYLIAK